MPEHRRAFEAGPVADRRPILRLIIDQAHVFCDGCIELSLLEQLVGLL